MSEIYCFICGERICKYELDFNSSDGVGIVIKNNVIKICGDCARKVARELIGI